MVYLIEAINRVGLWMQLSRYRKTSGKVFCTYKCHSNTTQLQTTELLPVYWIQYRQPQQRTGKSCKSVFLCCLKHNFFPLIFINKKNLASNSVSSDERTTKIRKLEYVLFDVHDLSQNKPKQVNNTIGVIDNKQIDCNYNMAELEALYCRVML